MRYYATVDGQTFEIDIQGIDQIAMDGLPVTADMRPVGRQDLYSLLFNQASHEIEIEATEGQRSQYGVLVAGTRYNVHVQDERARRLRVAERKVQPPAGETSLRAPIPGLVVKILVTPGQTVEQGQTLLMLEAMKMENDLTSPHAGIVHEVRVTAGSQVALGQVLLSIRAKE